jgi:hypothetical protein
MIFTRSLTGVNVFPVVVNATTIIYIILFLVGRRRHSF